MSEIKGQLLGIVLVIAIFGVVAGALTAAFSSVSDQITERIENVASYDVTVVNGKVVEEYVGIQHSSDKK